MKQERKGKQKINKMLITCGLGLILLSCLVPQSNAIIFGSYPPLPYWHGSMTNHTVWTDTNYTNVNVTDNLTARYFFGNGTFLTGIASSLPSGGSLNQILKNSGPRTANWGTVTENSGALAAVTTLNMNNQLTNTLAIGTSPFAITSTTVNTNLNADLWDGYHFSDYLDQAVKTSSTPSFSKISLTGTPNQITKVGTFNTFLNFVAATVADKTINIPNNNGVFAVAATSPIAISALGVITHSSASGYVHLPAGGSLNQVLVNTGLAGIGQWAGTTIDPGSSVVIDAANAVTGVSSLEISTRDDSVLKLTDTDDHYDDWFVENCKGGLLLFDKTTGVAAMGVAQTGGINFNAGSDMTITITDRNNLVFSTTTGTKLGIATNNKLSFYGSTPIVQPVNTVAIDTLLVNLGLRASGGTATFDTDIKTTTAGKGLYIKEGTNACMGTATLVGGTKTVSNTKVTANSRIFLTPQTLGTVARPCAVGVTARVAGTSFTITSADATDTSVVAWEIIEPS